MIIFLILVFGLFTIYFLLPVIAAVACALGRDFRYPILGDRLVRYLEFVPAEKGEEGVWLKEEYEFRWVAAMGHFSILILLWGMLAPLTAWIIQGKNSPFLRFQSIQTLVYQAATTVIFFAGSFLYLFGIVLLFAAMAGIGAPDLNSTMGIVSLLVLGVSLLIAVVLILIVPLLHILGQWAGYRVLKGEDYKYPFVGGLVERWLAHQNPLPGEGSLRLKGTL